MHLNPFSRREKESTDEEIVQPSVKNIRCIRGDLLVPQLGLFPYLVTTVNSLQLDILGQKGLLLVR